MLTLSLYILLPKTNPSKRINSLKLTTGFSKQSRHPKDYSILENRQISHLTSLLKVLWENTQKIQVLVLAELNIYDVSKDTKSGGSILAQSLKRQLDYVHILVQVQVTLFLLQLLARGEPGRPRGWLRPWITATSVGDPRSSHGILLQPDPAPAD